MFGGNSGQLKQMMQQMGIDLEELDVEEVVITTSDGEELVFEDVGVNRMEGQGQTVYQVMGAPTERTQGETEEETHTEEEEKTHQEESVGTQIEEDDVELVALRANVSEEEAREALEEAEGDLAEAISSLS